MPRNKYPEQTVEQILNIAEKLFIERGYEKTTIQDILDELKMSKGAIYHHFRSKDEILQAIIDNKLSCERNLMNDLAANTQGANAREKIQKILSAYLMNNSISFNQTNKGFLLSRINDPQIVVAGLQAAVVHLAPIFSGLFAEGAEDGSIQAEYPLEYAEIFLLLFCIWMKPFLFHRDSEQTRLRLLALKQLMNQLGADIISEEVIEQIMNFYNEKELF